MKHVLVARLDNLGDVLLSGPAVRAVAASGDHVTFLAGPGGREAAALLPGVDDVRVFDAPWVGFEPSPFDRRAIDDFTAELEAVAIDRAIVLTSFHQSALPLALLLRRAGVPEIAATSVDFAGSLLDLRHPYLEDAHEVEQSLSLVETLGYALPPGDDRGLRLRIPLPRPPLLPRPYVVVHPGASVPARRLATDVAARLVQRLTDDGWTVVVTGGQAERGLAAAVVGSPCAAGAIDLSGRLDLAAFAAVLEGAAALVCGNTGPAHLAAAVGTPVVQVFAPVVPLARWRPWGVASVVLGDQAIPCAGCRARSCPFDRQHCTAGITAESLADAVRALVDRDEAVPA